MLQSIFDKMTSPEWIISVAIASLLFSVTANYITRLIDKSFFKSVTLFQNARKKTLERKEKYENAKEMAAKDIAGNPEGQWIVMLIALRSEVRTVLFAIAPLFLAICVFHYETDPKLTIILLVPFTLIAAIGMMIEARKGTQWAQVLYRSTKITKLKIDNSSPSTKAKCSDK